MTESALKMNLTEESAPRKKGLGTSELWAAVAVSYTVVTNGAEDPSPWVRIAAIIGLSYVTGMYIYARARVKSS